jgi:uncharacterized protein YgiM (DUF1202 family)
MTTDIDLLSRCAEFTLSHTLRVEAEVLGELKTSAASRLVTALRMLRLQRAILAIGMFSLFESLLQNRMGWQQPFDRLNEYLTEHGACELAQTFNDYRLAVNVLKHGRGRSYEQLSEQSARLEFKVKSQGEAFFFEGDVSEVEVLIDADDKFVRRYAGLIQDVTAIIRANERVTI